MCYHENTCFIEKYFVKFSFRRYDIKQFNMFEMLAVQIWFRFIRAGRKDKRATTWVVLMVSKNLKDINLQLFIKMSNYYYL